MFIEFTMSGDVSLQERNTSNSFTIYTHVLPDIRIKNIPIYYKDGVLQDAMIMDICLSLLPEHIKIDEIMKGTRIGYNIVRETCENP